MQVIDSVDAMMAVPLMDTSMENIAFAMPYATPTGDGGATPYKVTVKSSNIGIMPDTAARKAEGVINLEVHAHWDAEDDAVDLCEIEDIETITDDTTPPTVVTVPADTDTAVVVSSNLTATFSEDIRQGDIHSGNLILMKASDGTVVEGTMTYTPATKTATFDPTSDLAANTDYIWLITNVRDLAGNKMVTVAANFKTA